MFRIKMSLCYGFVLRMSAYMAQLCTYAQCQHRLRIVLIGKDIIKIEVDEL